MNMAIYDTTAEQTFWAVTIDRRTGEAETAGPFVSAEAHELGLQAMSDVDNHLVLVPVIDTPKLEASE